MIFFRTTSHIITHSLIFFAGIEGFPSTLSSNSDFFRTDSIRATLLKYQNNFRLTKNLFSF